VLFSVTEGEDKPLKYPLAFNTSQVAAITKIDIADAVGYDRALATKNIATVNPGITILELSSRSGDGLDAWIALLDERIRTKAVATPA
jgi:hydrogenase nickel incorporation protein HypB